MFWTIFFPVFAAIVVGGSTLYLLHAALIAVIATREQRKQMTRDE
jgi:hypothetical protein